MLALIKRLPEGFRWRMFCLIEKASQIRGNGGVEATAALGDDSSGDVEHDADKPYIWVFCSTIGELNACKPLITLLDQRANLVLLTDRPGYEVAFRNHFPTAVVLRLFEGDWLGSRITNEYPPIALYLAEIPIVPADAPCRFSYGLLRTVKSLGASIYLVNGWLYGYEPDCRQDAIEREWFTIDYLHCFDVISVQTEGVRGALLAMGAEPERVHVTGNMKFDSLADTSINLDDDVSAGLTSQLQKPGSTVIVAGCLSDKWEYQLLMDGFSKVISQERDAKLVLVPRHPENPKQIDVLREMARESPLKVMFKTELTPGCAVEFDILILDTIGELRSYYSLSSVSYVGRNHNILEPLTFGKPVLVLEGWDEQFPSYPVYEAVKHAGLLTEVAEEEFASALSNLLTSGSGLKKESILEKLGALSGATAQNAEIIGIK